MNEQDAMKVLEAVLFASNQVLTTRQVAAVLGNTKISDIRKLVAALNGDYEANSRSFRIVKVGEGYQMRTLPIFKTWIKKVEPLKATRLSPPAMETLAIVAYRQPVTRAEIEQLRGVDASSSLRKLLELRLIRIVGKDKGPGRALIYGSTREFLSLFNLSGLRDLPTLDDFDLTVQEPTEKAEAG